MAPHQTPAINFSPNNLVYHCIPTRHEASDVQTLESGVGGACESTDPVACTLPETNSIGQLVFSWEAAAAAAGVEGKALHIIYRSGAIAFGLRVQHRGAWEAETVEIALVSGEFVKWEYNYIFVVVPGLSRSRVVHCAIVERGVVRGPRFPTFLISSLIHLHLGSHQGSFFWLQSPFLSK
jgi:hypothetical protein